MPRTIPTMQLEERCSCCGQKFLVREGLFVLVPLCDGTDGVSQQMVMADVCRKCDNPDSPQLKLSEVDSFIDSVIQADA